MVIAPNRRAVSGAADLLGIALVCAAALLLVRAPTAAGVALQPKTKARIFRAFDPSGHSLLRTKTRRGSCWVGSVAINRRDAWRCSARRIKDPCFSSARRPGFVLCPDAPWEHTGVRLALASPLPRKDGNRRRPSRRAHPWGIELFDGRNCLIQTGATTVVDNQRANYACDTGADWLWGNPDRGLVPWTIFSAPYDATALVNRAPIRRAWM
jgi:hypothetical protein